MRGYVLGNWWKKGKLFFYQTDDDANINVVFKVVCKVSFPPAGGVNALLHTIILKRIHNCIFFNLTVTLQFYGIIFAASLVVAQQAAYVSLMDET